MRSVAASLYYQPVKTKVMNTKELKKLIKEKYIRVQKHPTEELYIYNYTAKAQYDRVWNDITLACRGLIMDDQGNFVARPFPKFFNLGELESQNIPDFPFEVYEKMDGSLGISYSVNGEFFIATRGSFISEQSQRATEMLNTKYQIARAQMNTDYTYLFEIIYPENRIVLDYGDREELVLLGIIETKTGAEMPLEDIGFPVVKMYNGLTDITELKGLELENKEGFVVKFANNFRLKVKFEDYFRLHRIITRVTSYNIWEYLKTGESMEDVLDQVPDEFYDWVKATKSKLEANFVDIENQAKSDFKTLKTRKETAEYFRTCAYPNILFLMLDNKDYNDAIWRVIKPEYERPFLEYSGK